MPEPSFQKQPPLVIAFFTILLLIAGIIYRSYFQPSQETKGFQPTSLMMPTEPTPKLPIDLFQNNTFLKLQTYQPIAVPEPTERPNPFAAP